MKVRVLVDKRDQSSVAIVEWLVEVAVELGMPTTFVVSLSVFGCTLENC